MRGILLIALCVLATSGRSQSWSWARKQQTTGQQTIATTCSDDGGNMYVAGFQESVSATSTCTIDSGFFMLKYDVNGSVAWQKKIEFQPKKMVCLDNEIIVAGTYFDSLRIGTEKLVSAGHSEVFLASFSASGNFNWARSYGGANEDVFTDLIRTSQGEVALCGYFAGASSFEGVELNSGNLAYHSFIILVDETGSLKKVKTDNHFYAGNALMLRNDSKGNIYVSGRMADNDSDTSLHTYVSKYSSSLDLQFYNKSWTMYDVIDAIAVDKNDNVFIQKYNCSPNAFYTPSLEKLNADLVPVNKKMLGGQFSEYCLDKGVSCDGKGGLLISGFVMQRFLGQDSAHVENYAVKLKGGLDIIIGRINENGELSWVRNIGGEKDQLFSELHVSAGNCYVAGMFNMDLTSGGTNDTLCFASDTLLADGSWPQMFLAKLSTEPLSNEQVFGKIGLRIYPNPAAERFSIDATEEVQFIEIFSASGAIVKQASFFNAEKSVDVSDLEKGIYVVKVHLANGRKFGSRLLVNH